VEFNINSPKQLGDVLFNKLALPMPAKHGKGKKISTAVDVLKDWRPSTKSHAWCSNTATDETQIDLRRRAARAHSQPERACTQRLARRHRHWETLVGESKSAEYPIRTELGREIRAAFIAEPDTYCWRRIIRRSSYACLRITRKTNCW